MNKLFITRIPKAFNKKLMYELVIQFCPIVDFYFEPTGKFCIITTKTKKDLVYAHEMLNTIKKIKSEISGECFVVEVENKDPAIEDSVFKKMMSKFGSVKFRRGCLFFKKEESALKAIEKCNGKYVGGRKIKLIERNDMS